MRKSCQQGTGCCFCWAPKVCSAMQLQMLQWKPALDAACCHQLPVQTLGSLWKSVQLTWCCAFTLRCVKACQAIYYVLCNVGKHKQHHSQYLWLGQRVTLIGRLLTRSSWILQDPPGSWLYHCRAGSYSSTVVKSALQPLPRVNSVLS